MRIQTLIQYFALECGLYVCKLLDYALVIILGPMAIYVSCAVLVVLLIIVCFIFVSRQAD